jgi:hypothetical protein
MTFWSGQRNLRGNTGFAMGRKVPPANRKRHLLSGATRRRVAGAELRDSGEVFDVSTIYPVALGFNSEVTATHTSRTISLVDARRLFDATSPDTPYDDLARLVLEDNILQRRSIEGRRRGLRILREHYALRPDLPIYRALRLFWRSSLPGEQGLLALLCAAARDGLLRCSAEFILPTPSGQPVVKKDLHEHLASESPGHLSENVLARTVRNLLSTWTQSGHLRGRSQKVRCRAPAGIASTCYAVYLGYLQGRRGVGLFGTEWTRYLDLSAAEVEALVSDGWKRGLLSYNRSGTVVDISFPALPEPEGSS